MKKYLCDGWQAFTEPHEDREGVNVYLEYLGTDHLCSLACADGEGETSDGFPVPDKVIVMAWEWISEAGIDY